MTSKLKGKALLFGLNYESNPGARLQGCVNDVMNMADFIKTRIGIPVTMYTDVANPRDTSHTGMMRRIYELAIQSYRDKLDFVYIHFSGHGTSVRDANKDEADGEDEALVPSNFDKGGVLVDDFFHNVFEHFNPKTRVICVFDCCHSGSICDLKYSWDMPSKQPRIENGACAIKAKVLTLSGCMDNQTSADAYNILNDNKYSGALTTCLLLTLKENPSLCDNIFALQVAVQNKLKEKQFGQVPLIASTYDIANSPQFIPLKK